MCVSIYELLNVQAKSGRLIHIFIH